MEIKEYDGKKQRQLLTAMIVDRTVLGKITPRWDGEMFNSTWCNLIGNWCCGFYEKYEKAPGQQIESLFDKWASKAKDKESIQLIEKFLAQLSGEYGRLKRDSNSQYVLDLAEEYFNNQRLSKLADQIKDDLEDGNGEQAVRRVSDYGRVDIGQGAGIDVLSDAKALEAAFAEKSEPLIRYPDALGNFFDDAFERDGFIAILAPEKRGKSWWLQDIAWEGMRQQRRVAFFSVGDMSQNQMLRRLAIRAAGRPLKPTPPGKPLKIPKFLDHNPEEKSANVDHELREFKNPLRWEVAWDAFKEMNDKHGQSFLKLSTHPNSTINVRGIDGILRDWQREGWTADLIVIDYADILAPMNGNDEGREQINKTWKALRGLSQKWHGCVVTATQSDAASYSAETLSREHFSEDKRKYAHPTGFFGINQTEEEKENGIYRLNWLAWRDNDYQVTKCCYTAGCLGLARPAILSTF